MRTLVGLALAGAAGTIARYAVDGLVSQRLDGPFPWGTFAINISGAFALGFVFTLGTERVPLDPALRTAITVGFLGAYTTFSTLALETGRLLVDRSPTLALLNLGGSAVAGVGAVLLGMLLAQVV